MANSVDPDEMARILLQAISSGSTLFAQVSVLVCQAQRIKTFNHLINIYNVGGWVKLSVVF